MSIFEEAKYLFYRQRLVINRLAIDEELADQAVHQAAVGELAAKADKLLSDAVAYEKVTEAKVAYEIRSESDRKITDTGLSRDLFMNEEFVGAVESKNNARLSKELWENLYGDWKTRSHSLSRINDLIVHGYVTSSTIVDETRQKINEKRKQLQAKE